MIRIQIGAPLKKIQYSSKFRLVAYLEHGDAYQTTESEVFYDACDRHELERDIRGLRFMLSDPYPPAWEPKDQVNALTEFLGKDVDSFRDSFHVRDLDSSGNFYARLTGFNVTFIDSLGIEYEVDYTLEGEQHV